MTATIRESESSTEIDGFSRDCVVLQTSDIGERDFIHCQVIIMKIMMKTTPNMKDLRRKKPLIN